MSMNLVVLLYLLASVCFIQALKGLSHPKTSILGNAFGMGGMALAVIAMPGAALAQTEIDITGGRVDPLPIAISPFLAGGGAEDSAATISAVITNDLGRSRTVPCHRDGHGEGMIIGAAM